MRVFNGYVLLQKQEQKVSNSENPFMGQMRSMDEYLIVASGDAASASFIGKRVIIAAQSACQPVFIANQALVAVKITDLVVVLD